MKRSCSVWTLGLQVAVAASLLSGCGNEKRPVQLVDSATPSPSPSASAPRSNQKTKVRRVKSAAGAHETQVRVIQGGAAGLLEAAPKPQVLESSAPLSSPALAEAATTHSAAEAQVSSQSLPAGAVAPEPPLPQLPAAPPAQVVGQLRQELGAAKSSSQQARLAPEAALKMRAQLQQLNAGVEQPGFTSKEQRETVTELIGKADYSLSEAARSENAQSCASSVARAEQLVQQIDQALSGEAGQK